MPSFWYYILLAFVFIGAAVSTFGLWGYAPKVREVLVPGKNWQQSGRWTPLDKAPPSLVTKALTRRKRGLSIFITVMTLSLGTGAGLLFSGEVARQWEDVGQRQEAAEVEAAKILAASTEKAFVEPLTVDEARETIFSDKRVEMTVVLPNGDETTGEFVARTSGTGLISRYDYALVPESDEEAARLAALGWVENLDKQRAWLLQKAESPKLEKTYGIVLEEVQRTALGFPSAAPSHLTRYGSTEMTTALGDGTYFNGVVTLIWDGEFKLIGSEGTDRAQELTRR